MGGNHNLKTANPIFIKQQKIFFVRQKNNTGGGFRLKKNYLQGSILLNLSLNLPNYNLKFSFRKTYLCGPIN